MTKERTFIITVDDCGDMYKLLIRYLIEMNKCGEIEGWVIKEKLTNK